MKTFLKIAGIVIACLVLATAILPFAFKGKIIEAVKIEINKNLNAKVDFGSFGFNFFRNFPNATVSVNDIVIAGVGEFENDTLFSAGKLSATINLKSIFGENGYEIISIGLDQASVFAHILENGRVNWDIMKQTDSSDTETDDTTQTNFKILLEDLSIVKSKIVYADDSSKMQFSMSDFDLNLKGDLTADITKLKINLLSKSTGFGMDNIQYINDMKIDAKTDVEADLKNMKFTLADNYLKLNNIEGSLEGWVEILEDATEMDIKLNTKEIQLRDILSLIPAVYASDLNGLQATGEVALTAEVKGKMTETQIPQFDARLTVDKGEIRYTGLPETISAIKADIRAYNQIGLADATLLDVSAFHFVLAESPFDMSIKLKNPVSDPDFNLKAVGKIDLDALKKSFPLENIDLSGKLDANLTLATTMSAIEKEQYEKVNAEGTLALSDFVYKQQGSADMQIKSAKLAFSPKVVDLQSFSLVTGQNDIQAKGKLENFLPYFLKNDVLKGTLSVTSNYLNLNDFMTESTETSSSADTSSIGIVEIPRNLDFTLNGTFQEILFDKLEMKDVAGQIVVRNGKVDMKNLAMQALGGSITLNGSYDTGSNPQKPTVNMNLNINEVAFKETFNTFVSIQKIAPIFENLTGNYSTTLSLTTPLGADFTPDLQALSANGTLQSKSVQVTNSSVLSGLATALKNESLKDLKIKDLKLPFTINAGRVTTKPFNINFGEGTMNLQGSTGLDQTIDYSAVINLTGKLSNQYLNNLPVKIGGTFTSPKFTVDAKNAADQLLGNAVSKITGSEGSLSEQATAKAGEEIEKQAAKLRAEAKEAGEKLVAEAEKQGQKLIDEANKTSNPIAKIAAVKAAEASAKKLKEEAQKQADKLNAEAEEKIGKLQ